MEDNANEEAAWSLEADLQIRVMCFLVAESDRKTPRVKWVQKLVYDTDDAELSEAKKEKPPNTSEEKPAEAAKAAEWAYEWNKELRCGQMCRIADPSTTQLADQPDLDHDPDARDDHGDHELFVPASSPGGTSHETLGITLSILRQTIKKPVQNQMHVYFEKMNKQKHAIRITPRGDRMRQRPNKTLVRKSPKPPTHPPHTQTKKQTQTKRSNYEQKTNRNKTVPKQTRAQARRTQQKPGPNKILVRDLNENSARQVRILIQVSGATYSG